MTAIFKREFKSYFHSMIGPVIIAALLCLTGLFFVLYSMFQGYPYFSAALTSSSIILLFVVPVLTMRSFAEEKNLKTDQLLLTSPVSVTQIVLGKYLSMAAVFGIPCLIFFLAPVLIRLYGGGMLLADSVAVIEFFLMGAAYIAIGMFVSSLTENQLISAIGTLVILLFLQLADSIASYLPSSASGSYVCIFVLIIAAIVILHFLTKNLTVSLGTGVAAAAILTAFFIFKKSAFEGLIGSAFSSLSLVARFESIASQSFDISTIVYYLTIIALFVFLTVQSIQKRRWS